MGSVFEHISIEKAAKSLSFSRRRIYYLIKEGKLRTFKEGHKQLVFREDVAQIIASRETPSKIPFNQTAMAQQESRIHILETRVNFLMRLHDLHNDPLGLTALDLKGFHEMAELCLHTNWSPPQEDMWNDFFIRLQLEDLEKVQKALPDVTPWLVFHSLCRVLMAKPFDNGIKLQLRAGKVNIERIAYVWSTTQKKDSKNIAAEVDKEEKKVKKAIKRVTHAREKKQ